MGTNRVHDRLAGISAFVEAVEAGSFAQAAERMRLTRSAVGKSVARLELRLGVRLFHRTTRSQSLTEEGRAYYERCVRALAELDAGALVLDRSKSEPAGRLRLSAPVLFGRHCVAPVLRALACKYPRLEIEMSFSDQIVDLVEEGYDMAIRIGVRPDSATLVARQLTVQKMVICASPAYLAEHGRPSSVAELSQHTGIGYGRSGHLEPWVLRDQAGLIYKPQVDIRLMFDDLQAITDAALAGSGLALLPCWLMAKHAYAGELVLVMYSDELQISDVFAVWPQTHYLPHKTRVAIDALVTEIPKMIDHFEGGEQVDLKIR